MLFGPHVSAYMLGYVAMAKAAILAGAVLVLGRHQPKDPSLVARDIAMDRLVRVGFPLITVGLVLGCVWGKVAFGHWWQWDPKEMLSLATWAVFLAYFHLRGLAGRRFVRLQAVAVMLGMLMIVATLLYINLSKLLLKSYHTYAAS